jgi:hypothetical protein
MPARLWTQAPDGVVLDMRVTAPGGRDAIEGIERRANRRTVLKAFERAAPVEGDANEALRRLVAKVLSVAARQVDVAASASARVKRLLAGDALALSTTLEQLTKVGA